MPDYLARSANVLPGAMGYSAIQFSVSGGKGAVAVKRIAFLFIVLLPVLLIALVGGAEARLITGGERLQPGVTDRGYMLSADDQALYSLWAPRGMTLRPRIEVDPASTLRLKARIEMYPSNFVDDDCDDAVIEFDYVATSTIGDLIIEPCPGALDIDTPFFVTLDYDPVLLEQEPNGTTQDEIWLDTDVAFMTYEGAINPSDDIDRYFIDYSQLFLWQGGQSIGQTLRVTMSQRNSNLQPWLTLLGPNTQIDATTCGVQTATACIEFTPTEAGDYRVYARGAAGQGGYTLTFELPNMASEPNNTPEEWAVMGLSFPRMNAIDPVGDVDYFNFGHRAGDVLRVSVDLPEGYGLAHVAADVLDPNNNVLIHEVLSAANPSFDVVMPGWTGPGRFTLRISDADNGAGDPDAKFYRLTVEKIGPYVSSDLNGLGGRYARTQGDLLQRAFDNKGLYWELIFDASDVGITKDVVAAEFLPNGTLLLSLGAAQNVPGLGKVTPQDIIRFVPAYPYGLSDDTSGVFEWYLDGSDVGLTAAGEKIDAIALTSTDPDDFAIAVSLTGSGSVTKTGGGTLAVSDEDMIRLNNPVYGANSAGTWSLYVDGSALPGMMAEELNGATSLEPLTGLNASHNWLWLIQNAFNVDGVSGEARDVLNVRQGFSATNLEALGLSHDNLGDKRLDAITIGPPLDD